MAAPHATHAVNANAGSAPARPRAHKVSPDASPRDEKPSNGFLPAGGQPLTEIFPGDASAWKAALKKGKDETTKRDKEVVTSTIVKHVTTTLARAPFNVDDLALYQATALSVRDRLIAKWNATQLEHTQKKPKRVYYFSLEFLMGRSLDNALLNLGVKEEYSEAVKSLGFQMEDLLDNERDAGLGNGGLGRLAACYLDSLSTTNIPSWGYGLRYSYGIFRQLCDSNGSQLEVPDPWLDHANPWEIARLDNGVEVKFYGDAVRRDNGSGTWNGGLDVLAIPYDLPIPGFKTNNTNNIRLWSSKPKKSFDLAAFNAGDYEAAVREAGEAENITRVLYPNDNFDAGKLLRLKQQYFWCAASLADIVRRFKKLGQQWSEFPHYNAIQLNDTHPTIAIIELQRILIDEEAQPWDAAWDIVCKTFGYTNHTVLPEALETWPEPLIASLLPRHMQIIYDVNLFFLQKVEKKWPGDYGKLRSMSIIGEGELFPRVHKQVRMAHIAIIGSHKVNGVAELHSELVKEMFGDFVEFFGRDKFTNVTNGITARRWLLQANPGLASLITKKLGSDDYLLDLNKLRGLEKFADDVAFQKEWAAVKQANKERLAEYIESTLGITVNRNALFDVMCKRLHEYKRQFMNILGTIYRYLQLKKLSPEERKHVVPRLSVFAGKAAPGYYIAKLVIRLINAVSKKICADKEVSDILTVAFLPDYSVSLAEVIIPANDISEHISTAGTEASGTSNMKFVLNGGLLLGTADGANIEICEEVGEENVFFFGHLTPEVKGLRRAHHFGENQYPAELLEVINAIRSGMFGDAGVFEPLISTLFEGKDFYLVSDDFTSYLEAQRMVDESYVDRPAWVKKTILATSRMGKFSSDRAVLQYADEIWNVEPVKVESV
ncbi:BQ5605_C008g05082 [Microbotryum silenes-dioicae]|uniref:Alpha-1,4 glucan phosphorylase n=1 Tax=Microbotryum silenes-dioicae TaxID=796604 RepID=A0A2X0MFG7_9BASI|nr:BQ5605_C008g05082 [Microbotryum silenes-dioicae]